ncbi:MAG: hypothetical protein M1136_00330 [Chloroflexi bacterium]|nr:hypothetical protein [Chloroflexota bacterium]MCL5074086.1 hypothetical protein [Chloroflexota bacterium]
MADIAGAIPVKSISEEYHYIASQRCACGSRYKLQHQSLLLEGPYDLLRVVCLQCGAEREFLFDIRAFFGRTEGNEQGV